jgi:hypothetical protein
MFKRIYKVFDKFEDKNRMLLSRHPIFYGFLTGVGIVLFWRGVWHTADQLFLIQNSYISMALGAVLLLAIGTFVSSFIGNEIIISGIKKEKTAVEKIVIAEEQDLAHEFEDDARIMREIKEVRVQLAELKKVLEEKNKI